MFVSCLFALSWELRLHDEKLDHLHKAAHKQSQAGAFFQLPVFMISHANGHLYVGLNVYICESAIDLLV